MIRLNAKYTVEDCLRIDVREFKRWGHLEDGFVNGTIVFKRKTGKNSVGIMVNTDLEYQKESYVRLTYTVKNHQRERIDYDYKIPLSTTKCRFGGKRYWFRCYMNLQGKPCGRRVVAMYQAPGSDIFACRHCHNLSYYSKNQNRRNKYFPLIESARLKRLLEKDKPNIKRVFYNGKTTKKMESLLKLKDKIRYYNSLLNLSDFV